MMKAITCVTLTAKRQDELGTASGIAGAIRYVRLKASCVLWSAVSLLSPVLCSMKQSNLWTLRIFSKDPSKS